MKIGIWRDELWPYYIPDTGKDAVAEADFAIEVTPGTYRRWARISKDFINMTNEITKIVEQIEDAELGAELIVPEPTEDVELVVLWNKSHGFTAATRCGNVWQTRSGYDYKYHWKDLVALFGPPEAIFLPS